MSEQWWEKFDNKADIDKLNEKIKEICPELRLSSFLMKWQTNFATHAGVSFPVKGNKRIIDELAAIGFVNKGKRKNRSRYDAPWRDDYSFVIDMTYRLPEFPREQEET